MMYHKRPRSSTAAGIMCLLAMMQFGVARGGEAKLDLLCKDKPVSFTNIAEVRQLIQESKSTNQGNCNKFRDSFNEIDDILVYFETGKICNLDLVDKIRKFHNNFIDSSNSAPRNNIPKALEYFFKSVCFQINAKCKSVLVNNLEQDTKEDISESDYADFDLMRDHGINLFDHDNTVKDFDDILLLDDLASVKPADTEQDEQAGQKLSLVISDKTSDRIRKLIANCNNKFKPYYDKLIMPLIQLSNLGYNYQGELIERELNELKSNKLVHNWYNIVQMCEAFRTIRIYVNSDPSLSSDGHKTITIFTPEEAESLRQKKTIEEEMKLSGLYDKPIVYDPVIARMDKELWINDPEELRKLDKLVNNFKSSRTEADRVKARFLKKLVEKMKNSLTSGNVITLAREFTESGSSVDSENVNERFIMMMNEAVEDDAISRGDASSDDQERPVAGHGRSTRTEAGSWTTFWRGSKYRQQQKRPKPRPTLIVQPKNGTKTSRKVKNFFNRFKIRKGDLIMGIIAILGIIFIFIACLLHGR